MNIKPASVPDPTESDLYDVLIVGGGINGAGIARDMAGRGWKVLLVERDDLASHTSSSSTKLIHGGLRYLEYYEFSLVRKALQEREVLLKSAPHIMWPLRFVMPHDEAMRPAWFIRLGLFFYDHLARRELLPGSNSVDLRASPLGEPLKDHYSRGFEYSDGWVDDARLVLLNALDARERGATVLTRTACVNAQRGPEGWTATLQDAQGVQTTVRARALVNAAGPWAEAFLRGVARPAHGETLATKSLRLVKGSHIVVRRCFDHDHAYIFQNPDKRIIFAIPYEHDFTLIGTTDVELQGEPGNARISAEEQRYLCEQASRYFKRPVSEADVVWSYAGVRPLLEDEAGDPSAVTRDYLLEANRDGPPLLSVWGGKITTFRKLAEDASNLLGEMLGQRRAAWTRGTHLPGGDFSAWIGASRARRHSPGGDFERFVHAMCTRYPWLNETLARRLARAYGARVDIVMGQASDLAELGQEVAPGLYEAELRYLQREEWALNADDVLWRRSKLGLHLSQSQQAAVAQWMNSRQASAT